MYHDLINEPFPEIDIELSANMDEDVCQRTRMKMCLR